MGINEIIKVGTNIKNIRKRKGLTQKDMANLLNIPYSTYSNYENNNREPRKSMLIKIAQVLDVPISKLLSIEIENEILEKNSSVIPYDIKNIQKAELMEKLIKICGFNITFNEYSTSDSDLKECLKLQIKNNSIPFVYINDNIRSINLTTNEFNTFSKKILQLISFEINELF